MGSRLLLLAAACLPAVALGAESLTLERAVSLALERNEGARISQQEVEVSRARVAKARSFFFPDITLSGTYRRQPSIVSEGIGEVRPPDQLSGTATFLMPLFDGRYIPLYRAAARESQAAALQSARDVQLVAFEAADAYLQTLGLQEVSEAAQRRLELSRQTLEDATVRQKAGLVSSNDVTRAQLEFATAEQALTNARGAAELARLQLSYLIAAPVEALAPPGDALPASFEPGAPPPKLVEQAVAARTDLAAAEKRIEVAELNAQEPLWRFIPSLYLGAQYQQTSAAGRFGRSEDWFASLTANWVIFDGLERFADRDERLAQAEIARLNASRTRREVDVQVRSALVSLQSADAAVRQAVVAQRVARQNAQETNTLYSQGLARAIEVADANLGLFEADVAVARQQYALAAAWLDLRAALGLDPLGREQPK